MSFLSWSALVSLNCHPISSVSAYTVGGITESFVFFFSQADDRSLAVFSKLLGVDGPQMAHWLCHRRLAVGGEMLVKPMSGQQALEARDALAKHTYGQLFTWTVQRLNSALRTHRGQTKSFIGVLDIYGWVMSFGTLDANSFCGLIPLWGLFYPSRNIMQYSEVCCFISSVCYNKVRLTPFSLSEQVWDLWPEQFWAVLYKLCKWKTATAIQQSKSRDRQTCLSYCFGVCVCVISWQQYIITNLSLIE